MKNDVDILTYAMSLFSSFNPCKETHVKVPYCVKKNLVSCMLLDYVLHSKFASLHNCFARFRLKLTAKILKFATIELCKYDISLFPYSFHYFF